MDFVRARRALAGNLEAEGILKTKAVRDAFLKIPRESFVWPGYEESAYLDMPLGLGDSGQTISAPHMVVIMLEALCCEPGDSVLEVGTGSGYNAALLAEMVAGRGKSGGKVVSVERMPELVEFAKANLERSGYGGRVEVILSDGTLGYPPGDAEVYDKIVVTAAAPRIPLSLKEQLKVSGTLLIPRGPFGYQDLIKLVRISRERFTEENLGGCIFVPLVGRDGY